MIPFLDLKKINQPFEIAFQEKMKQFLAEGWYILGKEVKSFENNFATYTNSKYCIGVGNGLDALVFRTYILLGKLQKEDEVIVPANTYIASVLAVLYSLRNYGSKIKYENEYIGVNSRLDELQAAFLNAKLPNLDKENEIRRKIAKQYISQIKNDKLILPYWDETTNYVFHLFVIRTENRVALQEHLKSNGIDSMIHYPISSHKQKALANWNNMSFPITEKIHEQVLSIPLNSSLTIDEIQKIITILNLY